MAYQDNQGVAKGWPRGARPFQYSEQQKQVRFQQMHNQGLRQLFLTMSWDLRAQHGTPYIDYL